MLSKGYTCRARARVGSRIPKPASRRGPQSLPGSGLPDVSTGSETIVGQGPLDYNADRTIDSLRGMRPPARPAPSHAGAASS
eukprot:1448265-Rhodomonas_salina.1